jgi:hypothetical protein
MYTHKKSGVQYSDQQTKNYFDFLRKSDDEFARDYARHEFQKWAFQRYTYTPDAKSTFAEYAEKYNLLRADMTKAYNALCVTKGIRPKVVTLHTADELLGEMEAVEQTPPPSKL